MTEIIRTNWKNFALVVSLIVTIGTLLASFVRKGDLTFDNQKQKVDVIDLIEEGHNISKVEAAHVLDHVNDSNVHMTFEEKKEVIIMKQDIKKIIENQVIIGQDLDEIKQLIKNR